ncbi:FBD-associated F-box protein At1g61320 [Linum perenne]
MITTQRQDNEKRSAKRARRDRRRRIDNEDVEFQSLPNDVLELIFSFLHIRHRARFAVVATSFSQFYNRSIDLNFDQLFFNRLADKSQYISIVGRLMDRHNGPKIKSLKFYLDPKSNEVDWASTARWINIAAQKEVKELDFDFGHTFFQPFGLTSYLFNVRSLEILRLANCDVTSPVPTTGLRFLKECSLQKVNVDLAFLGVLFEQCLELEMLELLQCDTPSILNVSMGHSNKLKILRIVSCLNFTRVIIDAPSLIVLHYSGHFVVFKFVNIKKLTDVTLDFKPRRRILHVDHNELVTLLHAMSTIKILTVTSKLLEPKKVGKIQRGMMEWARIQKMLIDLAFKPCYPNLKVLKLIGFKFEPREMQLLYTFLENANNLDTVAIFLPPLRYCNVTTLNEALFNDQLRLMKASRSAWIRIFQHYEEKLFYPVNHLNI